MSHRTGYKNPSRKSYTTKSIKCSIEKLAVTPLDSNDGMFIKFSINL